VTLEIALVDPAQLDDAQRARMVELVNAAFARHGWLFPVDRVTAAGFREETASKQLLVLRIAAEPIAMAAFDVRGRAFHFGMAVVSPALHGQGVGARLLDELEARAGELGCERVEIETVDEIGNGDYYRRRGYVVTTVEQRAAGTWGAIAPFTLLHMTKRL
jgi:GNAT superfamily N-acetyltransferase